MINYELRNTDSEDIEDLLLRVETSFNIKFVSDELVYIRTFGQLCDHIKNKIKLEDVNNCTSQQAFYKLREVISTTLQIESKVITLDLLLTDILPRHNRRLKVKKIENYLGFKLNILRPSYWIIGIFIITLVISLIGLSLNLQTCFFGLVFSIFGLLLTNKMGRELDLQTVGQLVKNMTRENYLKSRRNPKTFNKNEIEKVLTDWFSNDLQIDKNRLTKDKEFF
ncbi:hypothetical protein WAF17_16090 [Bernardetia sp. ABR2-2B]|uniref:hypothetical protein n=1 Tax=Bernardetia sp. ABR2-2B TaxID=3127472 RepID=UPI0030D2FCDF